MSFSFLVISLPNAVDRRRRIREQFEQTGYEWRFIDAEVDAEQKNVASEPDQLFYLRRLLRKAELGCYASHCKALVDAASSNVEHVTFILEDDIALDPGFDFCALARWVIKVKLPYIRLYSRSLPITTRLGRFDEVRSLVRFNGRPNGTQAYAVSSAGAKRLLESIGPKETRKIKRPIDDAMDRYWDHKIYPYAIFPYPAMEITSKSNIRQGENMYKVNQRGVAQLIYFALDRANRYYSEIVARKNDRILRAAFKPE